MAKSRYQGVLIQPQRNELDWVADPDRLVNHIPRMEAFFEDLARYRQEAEEVARVTCYGRTTGTSRGGTVKHIGRVPIGLLGGLLWKDPAWGLDRRETYKWLERNPQYRVHRTLRS